MSASICGRVFEALYYAAQGGRLQRAVKLGAKMVKNAPCIKGELAERLAGLCKQNFSTVSHCPETLEELNRAAMAFRQIRMGQAKGIDANLLTIV